MSKQTYRVETRTVTYNTYEIDAETEDEARALYSFGELINEDLDYDDIESVTVIDRSEVK